MLMKQSSGTVNPKLWDPNPKPAKKMSDNNLNVNIDLDNIGQVKKQYKKIKKYMRSGLYQKSK